LLQNLLNLPKIVSASSFGHGESLYFSRDAVEYRISSGAITDTHSLAVVFDQLRLVKDCDISTKCAPLGMCRLQRIRPK